MELETSNPEDKEAFTPNPKNGELPQCKIKRNYSCNQCSYSTQNPRSHLEHLRDIHGEKIFINECCRCLYASRHYQKLVRHMKMVHGSINGICKQSQKRSYSEISTWLQQSRKIPSPPLPPLPPLPEPVENTFNINNLSNLDLELSRNTLKDIAALYFAQGLIGQILIQMEQADAILLPPTPKVANSHYNELKSSIVGEKSLICNCGYASKCSSEYEFHRRSCSYSNETPSHNMHRCQNCDQWCKSRVDLLHHQCNYSDEVTINLSSVSTRCRHCRMWCSSYADLVNHLQKCLKAAGLQNKDSTSDMEMKQGGEFSDLCVQNSGPADDTKRHGDILNKENKQQTHRECFEDTSYFAVETAPGYGKVIKKMPPEEELPSESLKKVFRCPQCPFWATTASRFHIHVVGHLNKKPFKCSLCAYRSNWRWDITKHIRIKSIRSSCHKNARVVMNSEAGRVDYAKYNRYSSLIKIIDEDGAAKLLKSCESQVGEHPVMPTNTFLYFNKRDSDIVTPVSEAEAGKERRTSHLVKASDDVKNNVAEKEIVCKSRESAMRHANDNSALSQETIHSGDSEMGLFSSLISGRDNRIVENSKMLHDNQDVVASHEQKSDLNNNTPFSDLIQHERLSKNIVETIQSVKNTPQKEGDIKTSSNCTRTTTASAIDTTQREQPAFRCGHCHQVSNWKHVIQRHCRLKHSGYLRIEAFDRNSDHCHPVYRPFEIHNNRNSNDLPVSPANDDSKHEHLSRDSLLNNFEISQLPSTSKHFRCPSCPHISKTRNELNLHQATHNTTAVTHPDSFENGISGTDNRSLNNLNSEAVSVLQICPYCPFKSACVKSFRHHLKYHISVSNFTEKHCCDHCDFSSTSEAIIVEHTQIHFAGNDSNKSMSSFTAYDNLELIVTAGKGRTENANIPTVIDFESDGDTDKEKMSLPSQKTILVNPKTGQVIKRGQ